MADVQSADDQGPAIIITICAIVGVSTLFVIGRLYVRISILKSTYLDDYLTVLSLVLSYITVGLEIWAVRSGNGRHAATLSPEQQSQAVLSTISGFAPNVLAYTVPKFAVAALLTRILNPSRIQRMILWGSASVCLVLVLLCITVLFAQCQPSSAQWDFDIVDKSCWDPWVLIYVAIVTGAYSAAIDLYLAVYPATVLFKLRMAMKKKIALSVALGIGSISSAIAAYKTSRLPALASPDFTYDTANLVVWTIIEGNSLILALCIPTLGPLIDQVAGRNIFGSTDRHRTYEKYNGSQAWSNNMKKSNAFEMKSSATTQGGNTTTLVRSNVDCADSQESILNDKPLRKNSGIMMTNSVSVSYDTGGVRGLTARDGERGY